MLIIKNLSLYLKKDLRLLLEDFSFSLLPNQKVALIGEEGNGKSTLLKAIYDAQSIGDYIDIQGTISAPNEVIAYLPQVPELTALDMSTEDYYTNSVDWEHFDYNYYHALSREMNFSDSRISKDLRLKQLSGGEKIKFQLLCEMMKRPTMLLLDEPSNDLDLESLAWLEAFIDKLDIPVLFISHDEELLENCANTIIHIEQLIKRSSPRHHIAKSTYAEYVERRGNAITRQTQTARKEREVYAQQMDRCRQIHDRVAHELNSVSRQEPSTGKNLKDKMRAVKSMERRFEKQKEQMTEIPNLETRILVRFSDQIELPKTKICLDFKFKAGTEAAYILNKDIALTLTGAEKICIVGANGIGKTTLLRQIAKVCKTQNLRIGYMPQDYSEGMDFERSALEFLAPDEIKDARTKARTYLGSMQFTPEEMTHKMADLSGGQRAKLYFASMILNEADILLLDEATRNLSPLSGPEIRAALRDFKGAIIAVSHDRKYISEVFDTVYKLDSEGLHEIHWQDAQN